jgi:biopolymer transport protein ExbB/TolQ
MNRLATLFWRSPVVWGLLLTYLFYLPIHSGIIQNAFVKRYLAGHWVEYVETGAFFVGVMALYFKWRDVRRQQTLVTEQLLPSASAEGELIEQIPLLLNHLQQKVGRFITDYLPRRTQDALLAIQRRGNADKLDEELKYLSDLDAVRAAQSYSFVKIVIWAIPILGFLGTVIGITEAIGSLSASQIEKSLPEVVAGLGVAFDTTAIALGFSILGR